MNGTPAGVPGSPTLRSCKLPGASCEELSETGWRRRSRQSPRRHSVVTLLIHQNRRSRHVSENRGMNTVGALLGTAWRASPPLLAGLLLVVLFQVLQPFVQAVLVGAVVDSLIGSLAGGGQPGAGLWPLVVFLLLLLVLTVVVGPVLQAVVAALSWRLEARVGRDLLGFVSRIGDVGILDDPQVSGGLGMIRGDNVTLRVSSAVGMFTGLVPMRVGALVMAGLLFSFAWWAPLVLVPGLLLTRLWLMRDGKAFMDSMRDAAGPRQRAAYLRDVMLDQLAAKDVSEYGPSECMLKQSVPHR